MFSIQSILVILLLLGFCFTSKANSRFVDGVNVVITPGSDFITGAEWGDEAKKEGIGGEVDLVSKFKAAVTDSPFGSWMRFPMNNAGSFKKMGKIIADGCKAIHKEDVLKTISCVAHSVNSTLKQTGWPDFFSFCRSHAAAFRAAFNELNIPRASVFDIDGTTSTDNHVVSRFILTSPTGRPFAYAIDVGANPGKVFPYSSITSEWHKTNPGKQPEFAYSEPEYYFGVKPPAKTTGE